MHSLLVAHVVFSLATVGLSTHLLLWLRPFLKGKFAGIESCKRFALLAASAYGITMLIGLALYPTYRVRVRAEYLDNPSAITRAAEQRAETRLLAERRNAESKAYRRGETPQLQPASVDSEHVARLADEQVKKGVRISRWFDVKEHWSTLGLLLAWALVLILFRWAPSSERKSIVYLVFGLAGGSAFISWSAAIIGILTSAAHSVAAL